MSYKSYKNLSESPERAKLWSANYETNPASAQSFQGGLDPIPQLQRTLGNRNVAQLIQAKRLTSEGNILGLQRKLTVGGADDQYEQEADRVARLVINTPDAAAANSMQRATSPEEDKDKMLQTKPLAASISPITQRQIVNNEEPEDKEKPVQAKFITGTSGEPLQRQPESEEKEKEKESIQAKSAGSMSDSFEAGGDVETRVNQSKGRGSPLPDPVRAYMEPRFGVDFSHVHVHTGSDAVQMNRDIGAQAFTHGSDVYFGEGHSPANSELTAHELTHVVQQTGGAAVLPNGPFVVKRQEQNCAREKMVSDPSPSLKKSASLTDDSSSILMKRDAAVSKGEATDPSNFKGAGMPLEPSIGTGMGAFFAADFSNVRVHTGGGVDGALAAMGARAMTQGSDVYFRTGEYKSDSNLGRELIGHELTHVIQQSDGRSSGLNAKAEDGSARNSLEGEADQKGAAAAAAAAAAVTAPFDWTQVDLGAFEAEIRRREATGEPVPVAKTKEEARAMPLAREIAGKCLKGAKTIPASPAGPAQYKKDWNEYPIFGGIYNQVEIVGLEGKKFIEQSAGSTASYDLGQHMGAKTSGANSRRDGNFGVELPPQTWNYDSYKNATWDLALQIKTGGQGTKTLSMHNWAFSDIEVSESFEVVDGGTAAPGSYSGNIYALEQKIPVVLSGDHVTQKVSHSEVFKNTSGWSIGREIVDASTFTRAMSFGFSAGLENAAKDKAGSEFGLSSNNVNTISNKISTLGGAAKTSSTATSGETTLMGVKGKTIRKYVYPVFSVMNYQVTAYPHNPATAEVIGKKPKTFGVSSVALVRVESIDADDEGKVTTENKPSYGLNAEEARLAAEKEGKEVGEAGGVKVKIALEHEVDAQKDFDKQDFHELLTEGEKSRVITKEWNTETVNKFDIVNASGQKVAGTGGWSLGSEGKYAGIGAKIGYSETKSTAAEFGDQVINSGTDGKAQSVKVSQEVTGPAPGSGKNIQVITAPLYRERVYNYSGYDTGAKQWVSLPIKGRSKYYYPIGSVTTKEVPPQTELKPEGHGKLSDKDTKEAAADAKSIKAKIDAEKDTTKKAALEKELEDRLAKNREAMEEVARRAHPSLTVIDRTKNIYEIELIVPAAESDKAKGITSTTKRIYRSTLEGLLDFTAPSTAAQNAADALKTAETDSPGSVKITSTPALGGTGAQGGVNPFPGDVDMAESIKIVAPTADAASTAMAAAIQDTVRKATAPRKDGTLGYTFHGCMIGVLPPDAKKPGAPVRFTPAQTMAGEMSYDKDAKHGGGKGTLTLAQAIASPAAGRSANTYWRGPIDEMGTYGEITKVLNYDAVKAGSGEYLFGTPKVGQSFQEVGFGGEGRHDTERARLLEPLSKDIAKYAAEGNWVKAIKRAYTVARMLNDVTALNLFEPLLGSDVSQMKQLIDHIEMFTNDVVNPRIDDKLRGGIGTSMNDAQAMTEASMLKARMTGIDDAKAYAGKMQEAIDTAEGKMTRNPKPYRIIEDEIVKPLEQKVKGNTEFAKKAQAALTASGYFNGK
jgi:hypothetical protein